MGEGKPACRQAGMGVDILDLIPPPESSPTVGGGIYFGSIGVQFKRKGFLVEFPENESKQEEEGSCSD